jgi:hypothetical protein
MNTDTNGPPPKPTTVEDHLLDPKIFRLVSHIRAGGLVTPSSTKKSRLEIEWSDGAVAEVESWLRSGDLEQLYRLVRTPLPPRPRTSPRVKCVSLRKYAPMLGEKLVELRGVEPLTPRLPALCSPN